MMAEVHCYPGILVTDLNGGVSGGVGVLRMGCRVRWSLGRWEGALHGMGRLDEILVGTHGGTTERFLWSEDG